MMRALLWVPFFVAIVSAAGLQATVDQRGISSLSYNGVNLINLDNQTGEPFVVNAYQLNNQTFSGLIGFTSSWDASSSTITWSYNWGNVACKFGVDDSQVTITCNVINNSTYTLNSIAINGLGLLYPETPLEFGAWGSYGGSAIPAFHNNVDAPSPIPLTFGSGMTVVVNNDAKPLYVGYQPWGTPNQYVVRFGSFIDDGLAWIGVAVPIYRPIAAGASDTYSISLRFAPNGTDYLTIVPDILSAYAVQYPQELKWEDRRPIGELFMTYSPAIPNSESSGNPRGYTFATGMNIHTAEGLAAFQSAALAFANNSVQILKKVGAQGVLVWDLEGQQYPQPATSYVGDPRLLPQMAPELDAIADEFFATYTKNGLRCGMTIRPMEIDFTVYPPNQVYTQGTEAELMIAKMAYAYKRWGCDIFYVDSDGGPDTATVPDLFQQTLEALPNVLIIPENIDSRYYAYGAPLASYWAPYKPLHTPPLAYQLWNRSFTVTYIGDCPNHDLKNNPGNPNQWAQMVQAVKNGDILSFRTWFDDEPLNSQVTEIYLEAGFPLL